MKRIVLLMVMLVAATLMAAPTVRPPALPEEEPEREAAAEVYEPVRKMTVTGQDLHALAGDLHDDVRKVLITLRKMHTEARPEEPTEPEEMSEESPAPAVWREDVPLRPELQQVLLEACAKNGVDPLIMLGLIETESGFRENAVSSTWDYGLCQLNHLYFDPSMTPEENLRTGVELLGRHLKTYGNISAALTAYHWGHDNGTRGYANVVLDKAAAWGYAA